MDVFDFAWISILFPNLIWSLVIDDGLIHGWLNMCDWNVGSVLYMIIIIITDMNFYMLAVIAGWKLHFGFKKRSVVLGWKFYLGFKKNDPLAMVIAYKFFFFWSTNVSFVRNVNWGIQTRDLSSLPSPFTLTQPLGQPYISRPISVC